MSGFSDVPISLAPHAVTYHDIFEAKYVTKYLEKHVDSHIYSGKSLRDRFMFKVKVLKLEKTGGSWRITTQNNEIKRRPMMLVGSSWPLATPRSRICRLYLAKINSKGLSFTRKSSEKLRPPSLLRTRLKSLRSLAVANQQLTWFTTQPKPEKVSIG